MKVQQIRDGIRIRRRMFTPEAADLNVDYPESARLALQAATRRKALRVTGAAKMARTRGPRLRRMTVRVPWL